MTPVDDVPREGLAGEYLFAGSAGDTSGHGLHGVVHGAVLTADRFGQANSAYEFDGKDDSIVVEPPPTLNAEALTVSVWARFALVAPREWWSNCVVCQDNGDDADQSHRVFQVSTFNGHIVWHRMVGARDPIFKRRIRPRIWYHIAAVYEAGVHKLYVDGVLCDEVRHPLWTHATEPLYIGRKGTPEPYFFFSGAIDDLRIYTRALSDTEIGALFREKGFEKPSDTASRVRHDPISGKWGWHGDVVLDLHFDGISAVTGMIMAGRPTNMVPIVTGTFDRARGGLRLEGVATDPARGVLDEHPYLIEGLLDENELMVTAKFGTLYEGNHTLTKAGARRRWWKHSRLRRMLLPPFFRTIRWVFGLRRPSRKANLRAMKARGETLASIVIRDADSAELAALAALHVTAWNATYNPMGIRGPTVDVRLAQWRDVFAHNDGSWFCLVAENTLGELVGFAHARLHENGTGDLSKIYLLREYQRIGLGGRLLGHVTRRYLQRGVRAMSLFVDPRNPSCAFYEHLGGKWKHDGDGSINHSWYEWTDLDALAARCPPD